MNKYQSSKAKTDCMTKEPITFDKLPQAVSYLIEQVNKIYQLVETLQPQKIDHQHQLIDIDKASILIQNQNRQYIDLLVQVSSQPINVVKNYISMRMSSLNG